MIHELNSYILLTQKVAEKVLWTIYRQLKKLKKYWRVENELSIKDILKGLKYKSCLSFQAYQKKNGGIYWLKSNNLLNKKYS